MFHGIILVVLTQICTDLVPGGLLYLLREILLTTLHSSTKLLNFLCCTVGSASPQILSHVSQVFPRG